MKIFRFPDELSASALIRGLDSDENKGNIIIRVQFRKTDLMIGSLGALMIILNRNTGKIYWRLL